MKRGRMLPISLKRGGGTSQAVALLRPFKERRDLFWVGGSLRFLGGPSSFGTISLSFTNVATGEGCLLSGIDRLPLANMLCYLWMMKPFHIIFIYLACFRP